MALKTDQNIKQELIKHKNILNRLAEPGWMEFKTTKYLLEKAPFKPYISGIGKEGTGAVFKIGKGKTAIILRADIDALKTPGGVAHICGHSSHTSALLQALILSASLEKIMNSSNKSAYFLFQPAEETYPSGAVSFIKEHPEILKQSKYAFASHVRPLIKKNTYGIQNGAIMARGDYFEIHIKGKMAHVKNPLKGADAIYAASLIVSHFKKLQFKHRNAIRLNVGIINGGRQSNTVADLCVLKGDVRLKNDIRQDFIKKRMEEIIGKSERETGCSIKLDYHSGYPVLLNNKKLVNTLSSIMENKGANVVNKGLFSFGCEDFSFISKQIPSLYVFVGTGDKHDIHEEKCTISDEGTVHVFEYFKAVLQWWFGEDFPCK